MNYHDEKKRFRTDSADIRIFVSSHKRFPVPQNELIYPVHVGAALSDVILDGFFPDNVGDNISLKNKSYCELTAQYWAWKNVSADYYGFFHYRRYLYPDIKKRRPYIIRSLPTTTLLKSLGYDEFYSLIIQYDILAPVGENMHISVREHYAKAKFHHSKDLALIETIIQERYPAYTIAMETYLNGSVCYFGNVFIMSRAIFNHYCSWLFSILDEFDKCANIHDYSANEQRVDGYLAERLFGIYYTYWKERLHCIEIPKVHFEPNKQIRRKKKLLNILLPPGSLCRAAVKWIINDN